MKQTAVEKMIQYFIEQKNNGVSHWCINDLLGQLHQAKAMEKEQREKDFVEGYKTRALASNLIFDAASELFAKSLFEQNQTFKSE